MKWFYHSFISLLFILVGSAFCARVARPKYVSYIIQREHGPTLISSHHAMSDGNSRWNNNKTIRNVLLLRVTLCLLGANVWSLGFSRFEDPNSWMVYPPSINGISPHLGQGHAEAFQMCLTVQKSQVGTRKSVAWFMISLYLLSIIEKFGDFFFSYK